MSTTENTASPNWVVSVSMADDLAAGDDPTYWALHDLATRDVAEDAEAIIDGIRVTTDTAQGVLERWLGACTEAWIAQAGRLGYEAHVWDPARYAGSDLRHNEAVAATCSVGDDDQVAEAVYGAYQSTWDTVTLPRLAEVEAQ